MGEKLSVTVRLNFRHRDTLLIGHIYRQLFGEEENEAELDKAEQDGENRKRPVDSSSNR